MKWLDKNKKLLKEIFDKEFPLNFRNIIQTIILTCLVFILSGFLANKIDTNFLLDKDKIFLLTKFIREIHLNIAFAIILICVIALYIHLALNEYVPSKKLIFFTFLTGIVIYQTALAKEHIFTDCFVYAHIIIILFLCQLGILISHLIKQFDIKKANENKTRQGFLPDNPERNPKKDNKGYSNYAKKIADKIKETHHEEAFAIGINGKWGTGKTTMSEFTKDYLKKEKDIISIDFKPWSSSTPDAIIKDFFETLQDELRPYHAALSRLLIRYSRKLTTIDSNVITQTIEYAANYILDLDATNKVYEKINAALKDIDKKIIIYIDDLDRLEQSEIMEVIRLIRNTANFYNTFFIVAYDKAYVNNALEKTGIYNHEKFLEKIFQLGVNLPYYDKGKLRKELAEKLKEGLSDEIVNSEIEEEINNLHVLDYWLENSRDVTRVVNSLLLNYERVKGYVVFNDFLLIEILRIFNQVLYKDIRSLDVKYFETIQLSHKLKTFEIKEGEKNGIKAKDKKILEFLFTNRSGKEITSDSINTNNSSLTNETVINGRRFLFYFQSPDIKGLTLERFDKLLDSEDNNKKFEIDEIFKEELSADLETRILDRESFTSNNEFFAYLKIILYFVNNTNTNFEQIAIHLYKILKRVNFNENNFEDELAELISTKFPDSKKKIRLLLEIYNIFNRGFERAKRQPPLTTEIHNQIVDKYLCDKNLLNKILEKCFETLCNNLGTYDLDFGKLVGETYRLLKTNNDPKNKILPFVKKFIENKALNSFLLEYIEPGDYDTTKMEEYLDGNISDFTFKIYKSHIILLYDDKFEELLDNNLSNPQVKEFKIFYDKLKEAKFKPVTFDFNNIPIRDRITSILEGISTQDEGFNKLSEESGILN